MYVCVRVSCACVCVENDGLVCIYALNLVFLSIHVCPCMNEFPVHVRQPNVLTRQYELMRLSLWCLPTVK